MVGAACLMVTMWQPAHCLFFQARSFRFLSEHRYQPMTTGGYDVIDIFRQIKKEETEISF